MTSSPRAPKRFVDVPTQTVTAGDIDLVYRELGEDRAGALPLVALTHLGANLDSWDPEVADALASERRVIMIGYRGVGASEGKVRDNFDGMATDVIAAIRALGLSRVDMFGLSMGGMVAQAVIERAPELVDRLVLAGSGPQGGPGLSRMTGVMIRGILRGALTFTNPTTLLFFTRTANGKAAAAAYQARLKLRRTGRDKAVSPGVMRAQLRAVSRWAAQSATATQAFQGPTLIVHGDQDRMVPIGNADALLKRFSGAVVQVFSDSGHGVVFQNRHAITESINNFLRR